MLIMDGVSENAHPCSGQVPIESTWPNGARHNARFVSEGSNSTVSEPRHPLFQTRLWLHAQPTHPFGGKTSQTVSPGSPVGKYPPRKEAPKSTHKQRRPRGDAQSDKHELCDRKFPFPRRRPPGDPHGSPSYPVRSPRTLQSPPSHTRQGPSESHPLRTHGASLRGGWPKLKIPPWLEAGEGCYVTPSRRPGVRGAVSCWSIVRVGFTQN